MTTAAMLMKEIETLPDEYMAEAFDLIVSLKNKSVETSTRRLGKISIEEAYGIFKGIDTHFERDEEDRV